MLITKRKALHTPLLSLLGIIVQGGQEKKYCKSETGIKNLTFITKIICMFKSYMQGLLKTLGAKPFKLSTVIILSFRMKHSFQFSTPIYNYFLPTNTEGVQPPLVCTLKWTHQWWSSKALNLTKTTQSLAGWIHMATCDRNPTTNPKSNGWLLQLMCSLNAMQQFVGKLVWWPYKTICVCYTKY